MQASQYFAGGGDGGQRHGLGYASKAAAFQASQTSSGTESCTSKRQGCPTYRLGMSRIDLLRRQHDDALAMADRLVDLIDNFRGGQTVYPIIMQLNRLTGLLRVHLAHEDVELYPRLIASGDPTVARIAKLYVEEMGGLAGELEQFARCWSCSASISVGFDEFREGVHQLMLALAVRIERENLYLYPLAESEPDSVERSATRRDAA
ncbi:MAG TPA: hemerythrin domain-containing protein [Sphingomicrobium sp.]|nr:hemerythrin domain-containing protein [Sphingomicrobium sp.]